MWLLCILEGMRRVLLCMLEGEFCLPEALEVMPCVLLHILEAMEGVLCALCAGGAGGDALCATPYAGGCGR